MTTYTLFRLSDRQLIERACHAAPLYAAPPGRTDRHPQPDTLRRYMEFNRLSIICAKRGYMLCISD